MTQRQKWLVTGGCGASLFGFGLCATIECGFLKFSGSSWWVWSSLGTASLVVTLTGLVLLIKAGGMEKDIN